MEREPLHRLMRSLRTLTGPPVAGLSDAQLLERFVASRDEAAFELLLWRHGPTVLGVCRRLLSDPNDAEDAFQATFLALARKAGSITRREVVGTWLYRVAYRVATRARAERARRASREQGDVDQLLAPAGVDPAWRELRAVLDEEVDHLPARHRDAFVLCCLEGKTGEEAARQLGCAPGTVSSRLTRARERLRRRLARRGLGPAALAGAGAGDVLAPAVSPELVGPTLQAALVFTSGKAVGGVLSARAVAHAEGVLRAMFLSRLKIAALFLLVASFLTAGGIVTRQALAAAPPGAVKDERQVEPARADAKDKEKALLAVTVVKPQPGGLGRRISQAGRVEAFERADLYAVGPGVLQGQVVDIGTRVKKGQLLAQVDAPLLVLAEKQASTAVTQARGLMREAEARVATSKAEVKAAHGAIVQRQAELEGARATQTFHDRQMARMRALRAGGSVEQTAVDQTEGKAAAAKAAAAAAAAALATAKADLEVKEGKILQAEATLATARTNVEAAAIELEKARYSLSLTRIVAPFDGVVTHRNYHSGHLLRAGEGGSRLPLLTVQRTDRMRVVAEVAEGDAPKVNPGAAVELTVAALPGVRFTGITVSRVGYAVDPGTGRMRVEVDVPNPKGQLRPGLFARVAIELEKARTDAFRLPVKSLANSPPSLAVYVVRDGKAHRTPVRFGTIVGDVVEVLSGVKAGDLVVADVKGLKGEVVPVEVKEKADR
jgi:RNA polymerase sigma factor (sigma-70 family)